ncbi:MAG: FtsX-like permease family protein [Planctomycetota bacterium]
MAHVPFAYNLRSLFARPASTVLTVLGIGATVAVLGGMLCLQQGFATLLVERGRADLAVVLRQGATSEGESGFSRERVDYLVKSTPEFEVAAAELYLAVRRAKVDGGEVNVPLRGVQEATFAIHGDDLQVVAGRKLQFGADEVMVGESLTDRIRDCRIDDVLVFNTTPFRVVGIMRGRGAMNSEVWGDVNRMQEALQRPSFSRVLAKVRPGTDFAALAKRMEGDERVPAKVQDERDYLQGQTMALSVALSLVGIFLGLVMGIGAVFTGVNAMLSAVASRTHEIGVLRALGFRSGAIFASFLLEAALLGLLGGAVGCLLLVPLNGIQTGTMNFQTFSEIVFGFRVTPFVVGVSVGVALLLGLLGGALPAWRASRLSATQALRRA